VRWVGAVCALVVGAVFVVAGANKIAAGSRWPVEARELGAPTLLIPVVPWWELVVGALLAVGLVTPWAAIAAVVTLVAFTLLLVRVLRRGQHPSCACFGAWSSSPVGWRHVARNVALIGVAVVSLAR
jgi:DoxX